MLLMSDSFLVPDAPMRRIEKSLFAANLLGSAMFGWQHELGWLLLPPLAFIAFMLAEDRAVRQQIGTAVWPSPEYARFLFGTNLYRAIANSVLGAAIFAIASTMSSRLGG